MIQSIEELREKMYSFDPNEVVEKIINFLQNFSKKHGIKKFVVGLSGGIDSSTTLKIMVDAFGEKNVLALIMPHKGITTREDLQDAYMVVDRFSVDYYVLEIADICGTIRHRLTPFIEIDKKVYGNIMARTRMLILYAFANAMRAVVVGTSDKSEYMIGYFTKWGDAAADIFPIIDIYKTQLRIIAKEIGVPEKIIKKPSSPGLWLGQTAEKELGITYETMDPILFAIHELEIQIENIKTIEGIDPVIFDKVIGMINTTEHKRKIFYPKIQDCIISKKMMGLCI